MTAIGSVVSRSTWLAWRAWKGWESISSSPKWLFRLPRWSLCDGAGFRPTSEFGLRHEVGYHDVFKGPDPERIRLFLRGLVLNRIMFPGKHRRDGRAVDSTLNHDTELAAVSEIVRDVKEETWRRRFLSRHRVLIDRGSRLTSSRTDSSSLLVSILYERLLICGATIYRAKNFKI